MQMLKNILLTLSTCGLIAFTVNTAGPAEAFHGSTIATCSDDIDATDPFRVMNKVQADTTQPEYMVLRFISTQPHYPFHGIVTVNWHNLSNGRSGIFQLERTNKGYNHAAVNTGAGLVALWIVFSNTITIPDSRPLSPAQCNAQVDVISKNVTSGNSMVGN